MDLITQMAPDGWKFCSADFSMQAANRSGGNVNGWVQLIRDPEGKSHWHSRLEESAAAKGVNVLDLDAENDEYPLYVIGEGPTLEAALADAWDKAIVLKPIIKK